MMLNRDFEGDPDGISAWKWKMQVDLHGGVVVSLLKHRAFIFCLSSVCVTMGGQCLGDDEEERKETKKRNKKKDKKDKDTERIVFLIYFILYMV